MRCSSLSSIALSLACGAPGDATEAGGDSSGSSQTSAGDDRSSSSQSSSGVDDTSDGDGSSSDSTGGEPSPSYCEPCPDCPPGGEQIFATPLGDEGYTLNRVNSVALLEDTIVAGLHTSGGSHDALVYGVRFDGTLGFMHTIDYGGDEEAAVVGRDAGGRAIVVGSIDGGGQDYDVLVQAIESDGTVAWTTIEDSQPSEISRSGIIDGQGRPVVVDMRSDETNLYVWVRAYDQDGEPSWTAQWDEGFVTSAALDIDALGRVVAHGSTFMFDTFYGWVRVFDERGSVVWQTSFDSTVRIAADPWGGLYGVHSISVPTSGSTSLSAFDAEGQPRWTTEVPGGLALGTGPMVSSDGAIMLADNVGEIPAERDVIVRWYDAEGELQWQDDFGARGVPDDFSSHVADSTGRILVAGTSGSTGSGLEHGYWVRAYDETGLLWQRDNDTPDDDLAPRLAVDGCGDTFVLGDIFMERLDHDGRTCSPGRVASAA